MSRAWHAVDERVEVRERAEQRVDVAVVGDVVAEVGHRRGEERRQPDRLDLQRVEMVEVGGDAAQVADAVAVGVGERARVDLVDGAALPPGERRRQPPLRQLPRRVRLLPPFGSNSCMYVGVEDKVDALARCGAAERVEARDDLLDVAAAVAGQVLHAGVRGELESSVGLHGAVLDVEVDVELGAHRLHHGDGGAEAQAWACSGSTSASSKCSGRTPAITSRRRRWP